LRRLALLSLQADGRIVGYFNEWQAEDLGKDTADPSDNSWYREALVHWAVRDTLGCGHPVAAGEWSYLDEWKDSSTSNDVYGPWYDGSN
jgi:hypothetical protein